MNEVTKADETRKKILDSALKLFQSKGFEATTMRDIAEKAGMAVGAAYYHFRSKEEIVFGYYSATQEEADLFAEELVAKERDVKTRLDRLIRFRLEQLLPYRSFLSVLGQTAVSPKNPLSPFSAETKELRDRCIRLFETILGGGALKASKQLAPFLPKILWFYQMGIIFFWMQDESSGQKRTDLLLRETLALMLRVIGLSSFPLLRPLNSKVVRVISILEGSPVK